MQDLNDKITGNTLTAAEWNEVPSELQNVITAFQGLSGGDLDQLGKAIAGYAAAGDWYTGGGAENVYIATKAATLQAPPQYNVGQTVRLRPTVDNTGASTINVNALGVKDIKREDGTALAAGDIVTTRDLWIRYDGTDFLLLEAASSSIDTSAASSPAEAIGSLIWVDDSTVSLIPGVGGNIIINIDGTKLTTASAINFILGDFGVGGSVLDTGTEDNSTPYYLYIDNLAGVMTPVISALAPIELGLANAGYHPTRTDERCVGSVWNNGSDDITPFFMDGNKVMFKDHDVSHEYDLQTTASTSWRNLPLNLPLTAASVSISASSLWPTSTGMVCWGADGATGSLTGSEIDPTVFGFEDVLLHASSFGTNDGNGQSIHGSLPIVDRASPAISYGITKGIPNVYIMIVRGYTDIWVIH